MKVQCQLLLALYSFALFKTSLFHCLDLLQTQTCNGKEGGVSSLSFISPPPTLVSSLAWMGPGRQRDWRERTGSNEDGAVANRLWAPLGVADIQMLILKTSIYCSWRAVPPPTGFQQSIPYKPSFVVCSRCRQVHFFRIRLQLPSAGYRSGFWEIHIFVDLSLSLSLCRARAQSNWPLPAFRGQTWVILCISQICRKCRTSSLFSSPNTSCIWLNVKDSASSTPQKKNTRNTDTSAARNSLVRLCNPSESLAF